MARPKATLSPGMETFRERIEAWRRTRICRTRMPEDLWQAAVALAREHGAWAIAHAFGVRYEGLRERLRESNGASETNPAAFVALPPALPSPSSEATMLIEVSRVDGTSLKLRFPSAIDVRSLIDAFCQGRR